jgi:hypothetical protein
VESHREVHALILFLLIVTGRLDHELTKRPAPEMAVALWAWWSFARMASPDSIARRAGKAGRARKARAEARRSGFEVPKTPNFEPSLVPPISCGAHPD